jgi:Spy/CpxP family protein refolding chaperone
MMRVYSFGLVWIFLACGAFAQTPGMFPWWDSPVARDLALNEQQSDQIRAAVRAARGQLVQLQGTVQRAETDLRGEMNQDRVDPQRASDAIERVVAARSELMRAVSQLSLNLRLILTSAQWQELQKREAQRPMQGPRRDMAPQRIPQGLRGPRL